MCARLLFSSSYAHPSTAVEKKYPGDRERLGRLSLIEGSIYLVTAVITSLTYMPLSRGLPKAGPNGQPCSCREQKSQWCCRTSFRLGEEKPLPGLRRVLRAKQVWERHKRKCVYLVCYSSLFDDLMSLLQSHLVDGSTRYFCNSSLFHQTPLIMA